MEAKKKISLLERYGIPIHHLDFKYIDDCKDGREMEKILHILRSNEEGYFPDLTKSAEKKLKELKPASRLFRLEEQIKGHEALDPNELVPIYAWNKDIKKTDKKLQEIVQMSSDHNMNDPQMPPIRKGGIISQNQAQEEKPLRAASSKEDTSACHERRIKSTDYSKWDKYDPDEEILRFDLAEERKQEEVERRNRSNMERLSNDGLIIQEIENDSDRPVLNLCNLSEIEKEKLSEEYRLRGNEYFRSKEYDLALKDYTRAIECSPETAVSAYNNRALTYFKQKQFLDSIKDSERVLQLEPTNLKARLRLAEASYAFGRRRESYQLYVNVLKLDSANSVALKATTELRKQFEDLPPPNSTRLQIQEESSKNNQIKAEAKKEENSKFSPKTNTKPSNYDLADLVRPNRVVQNKLLKAAESFGKDTKSTKKAVAEQQIKQDNTDTELELRLPAHNEKRWARKLIEEL